MYERRVDLSLFFFFFLQFSAKAFTRIKSDAGLAMCDKICNEISYDFCEALFFLQLNLAYLEKNLIKENFEIEKKKIFFYFKKLRLVR